MAETVLRLLRIFRPNRSFQSQATHVLLLEGDCEVVVLQTEAPCAVERKGGAVCTEFVQQRNVGLAEHMPGHRDRDFDSSEDRRQCDVRHRGVYGGWAITDPSMFSSCGPDGAGRQRTISEGVRPEQSGVLMTKSVDEKRIWRYFRIVGVFSRRQSGRGRRMAVG